MPNRMSQISNDGNKDVHDMIRKCCSGDMNVCEKREHFRRSEIYQQEILEHYRQSYVYMYIYTLINSSIQKYHFKHNFETRDE